MSTEIVATDEFVPSDQAAVEAYLKQIRQRRSIRKLSSGPVADETIHAILEAGRWSPSMGNMQPARIILVKERHQELWDFIEQTLKSKLEGEQLERALARLPGYRSGIFTLVFYEDTSLRDKLPAGVRSEVAESLLVQSMGITQINVWNAITAAGLTASNQHINLQMEEELRGFLGVPAIWNSYSIFPVGYAAETVPEGTRRPYEEVIFHEHGPV